jgi:copper transport protein
MRSRNRRRAVRALLIAGLLLAIPPPAVAWGHAAFLEASPEPGTRLESGPGEISLTFTEPLNRKLSDASLRNASSGTEIPVTVLDRGRKLILRPQRRLLRAPYEVRWHTVSTLDGHPLEGSFGFGVQTAALSGEQSVEQSPLARDGWLRIATRALFYAALFFFAGAVLNAFLVGRSRDLERWLLPQELGVPMRAADLRPDEMAARLRQRALNAGALALLAAIAVAVVEAADAGGGLSLSTLNDYLLTNEAGLARVGTIATLALALWAAGGSWLRVSGLAVALAFLTVSFSGHANSAEPRSLAILTDWIHLVAAAVWVGGLAQIAAAWLSTLVGARREMRVAVMRSVLAPFGRVALPAFVFVVATGSINALIELGHVEELWQSGYGRVLAVKIALVAAIAVASYVHAIRLRPRLIAANPHPQGPAERRHWRMLGVEPWLGLGALALAAALVAFPLPPRQLGEADETEAAAPCEPSCPLPGLRSDQLAVAEQAGPRLAAFWLHRDGGRLTGTMRLLSANTKPVEGSVEIEEGAAQGCGSGCWRLTVPGSPRQLEASVSVGGRVSRVSVPATWQPDRNREAASLLRRAEAEMRKLRSLRIDEALTSGLGLIVRSGYRLLAPDRMVYRASTGGRTIVIGKIAYTSVGGGPPRKGPFGAGGFRVADLLRWTPYGRAVSWLGERRDRVRIALYDRATPVWYRLVIDRSSKRIVDERMIAAGHFMSRRYLAFNSPLDIHPPR